MATAREALEVQATLQDRFTAPLNRIQGRIRTFAQRSLLSFNRLAGSVVNLRGLLIGLGGALTVRAFARMITGAAEAADRIGKLSDRLGISVEFLSKLEFVADRSGIQFNQFATSIQRLTRRAAEFRLTGAGPAAEGFRLLGEDIVQAVKAGEEIETLLPKIADAFTRIEDPQKRVLIAMKLFDSEGVASLQALNRGFREVIRDAERFGAVITQEDARAAAEFNDRLTDMTTALASLKREIGLAALPTLTQNLTDLAEWIRDNREEVIDFFAEAIPQAIHTAHRAILLIEESVTRIRIVGKVIEDFFTRPGAGTFGVPTPTQADSDRIKRDLDSLLRNLDEIERRRDEIEIGRLDKRQQAATESAQRRFLDRTFQDPAFRRQIEALPDFPGAAVPVAGEATPEVVPVSQVRAFVPEVERAKTATQGLAAGLAQVADQGSAFNVMRGGVVQLASTLEGSLTNNLVAFLNQAEEGKFRFKDFARSVLRDLQRIAIQMAVVRAIGAAAGLLGGGGASAAATSTTPASQHGILATAAQHGGVLGGTRPQFVFAHPPEAFVPLPGPGRGIPVEFTGRRGVGGEAVVINQTFNLSMIDTKSFDDRALESLARHGETFAASSADQFRRDPAMAESFLPRGGRS